MGSLLQDRQGAKLTLIGILTGAVATTVSTRWLASFLFGV